MKFKRIRQKLITTVLPIISISIILLIAVTYSEAKEVIEKESREILEASGAYCASNINAWSGKTLAVLDTAVETISVQNMNENEILEYEKQFLGTYDAFPNGIYIAQSNKHLIDASGWEPEGDITKKDWYLEGLEHPKSMLFGDPYIDNLTGDYVVTASRHLDILGIDATVAADVDLSIISKEVASIEVCAQGDAFVIDSKNGVILASKDDTVVSRNVYELDNKYYAKVCDAIKKGELETNTYDLYITSVNPITNTDWYIVTRAHEKNIFRDIRRIGTVLSIIGVFTLAVVTVIVAIVIDLTVKPINGLNKAIKNVTDGDFTIDIKSNGADEIAQMAHNMNNYIVSMRVMLAEIIQSAKTIDIQADDSQNVSIELNNSANEQVEAMNNLLDNLHELVDSVAIIAENSTALAETVMGITNSSKEAISTMNSTKIEAENGKESMDDVNKSMKFIQDGMEKLEISITDVGNATDKIEEITQTIKNIASQTNLLALNASIEAARAGESGRGFGVVADEIKNLAATSGNAANEISELIVNVTSLIDLTVQESRDNSQKIAGSVELVDKAAAQFNTIYSGIDKTNVLVQNVINDIIQVSDVANNMAAITEEQSASAHEIEHNAIYINTIAEKVQTNGKMVEAQSELLTKASEILRDNIDKFKI